MNVSRLLSNEAPTVLVHASISDMRSWEPLAPLVTNHIRVINYSRRFAYARVSPARQQQMADNVKAHRVALRSSGLPVFTAAEVAAIQVPPRLVRGSDTPGFQRRIDKRLAELIPKASPKARDVCIPNAHHLVDEDNSRAAPEAICAFCGMH